MAALLASSRTKGLIAIASYPRQKTLGFYRLAASLRNDRAVKDRRCNGGLCSANSRSSVLTVPKPLCLISYADGDTRPHGCDAKPFVIPEVQTPAECGYSPIEREQGKIINYPYLVFVQSSKELKDYLQPITCTSPCFAEAAMKRKLRVFTTIWS